MSKPKKKAKRKPSALAQAKARIAELEAKLAPARPVWTDGCGGDRFIDEMEDAHIFYAIARAYRDGYNDIPQRDAQVESLKIEALRRLATELGDETAAAECVLAVFGRTR